MAEATRGSVARRKRSLWDTIRASRWLMAGVVLVALVALFGVFLGGVQVFQWTESTAFCSSCHVMKPEVTAYSGSPHSRVDCGTCHVGPGAIPAVQAKLAALRYLWVYPTNQYQKPIQSPITSLRPVEVVCEQCHWPQKFYEDRVQVINQYGTDQNNSLTRTVLQLHTSSSPANTMSRGVHWHIENPVYYIATDDKRQNIPWVQAEYNGKTVTYQSVDSTLTADQIASADKRKMDCVDCHNRATHVFQEPGAAIDNALSNGAIPADLPSIKEQGLAVLSAKYATEDDAAKAISGVTDFYRTTYPDVFGKREADVNKAVAGLQQIFDTSQFPFMKVDWQTHPNNIGHDDSAGCFRCHDGKHLSQDNQAIRLECNICHAIPEVAGPGQTLQPIPVVSASQEPDSHKSTTWLSEHRAKFDQTCAGCHTIENPGGSDNSSFCSNSACHGTAWKFAGLNAPQIRQMIAAPQAPAASQPPQIPHPITPRVNCLLCHSAGKVRPFPANHASYTISMCTTCHQAVLNDTAQPANAATPTAAPPATPAGQATPAASAPAASTPAESAGGPPAIPHALDDAHKQCLTCHATDSTIKAAPADHAGRTEDTCQACHKPAAAPAAGAGSPEAATPAPATSAAATPAASTPAASAPAASGGGVPSIPHALDDAHKQCLMCHATDSTIKPAPANHAGRTEDQCQTCHKPAAGASAGTPQAGPAAAAPAGAIPSIPHALDDVHKQCLMCHATDSSIKPAPANHAGRTEDTCQTCHKPKA